MAYVREECWEKDDFFSPLLVVGIGADLKYLPLMATPFKEDAAFTVPFPSAVGIQENFAACVHRSCSKRVSFLPVLPLRKDKMLGTVVTEIQFDLVFGLYSTESIL